MEVEINKRKPQATKPADPKPEPATPEPPPTPEEIKKRADDAFLAMGWKPEPAAAVEPPPAPPVEEPPSPEPPPQPEPEPQPVEAEIEISPADLIRQTAKETAIEVARVTQDRPAPQPQQPPQQPPLHMSPEDASDFEAIAFLDRTDPKYAGKSQQYQDYLRKLYAYRTKWESENQGEEFDPNSNDHADFYGENEPDITIADIERGRARMEVRAEMERDVMPEIRQYRQEKALEQHAGEMVSNVSKRLASLVTAVDPELAKRVVDPQGNLIMDQATLKDIEENGDPVTNEALMETITGEDLPVHNLLVELEKLGTDTGDSETRYKLDMRKPTHRLIDSFRQEKERQMASAPTDQQIVNGKRWISIAEMQKLNPEQAQQHWVLTVDHLADLLIDRAAKKARAQIAKQNAIFAKKQAKQPKPTPQPAQPAPAAPRPAAPSTSGKPQSPSFSSGSDVLTPGKSSGQPAETAGERAARVMFS